MLTPSAPTPPVTITSSLRGESPIDAYVNDVMTVPASLARLPALALPITTTSIDVLGSLMEVCCVCCMCVCPTTYPYYISVIQIVFTLFHMSNTYNSYLLLTGCKYCVLYSLCCGYHTSIGTSGRATHVKALR
jgi:hypothetical protein